MNLYAVCGWHTEETNATKANFINKTFIFKMIFDKKCLHTHTHTLQKLNLFVLSFSSFSSSFQEGRKI